MRTYVVMRCRFTWLLFREHWADYGLWTPTYQSRFVHKGEVRTRNVCALPGFVFVPEENAAKVLQVVQPQHDLRVMRKRPDGHPAVVTLDELRRMERALRMEQSTSAPRTVHRVGDRVQFVHGPLQGLTGEVVRVRGANVRVLLGTKYVTSNAAFLQTAKEVLQ